MARYIQCTETGKLIPASEFYSNESVNAPAVHGDFAEFVSPISKELITCRGQLRRHNREHGVTNSADYSQEFLHRKATQRDNEMTGNTARHKRERRQAILQTIQEYQSR